MPVTNCELLSFFLLNSLGLEHQMEPGQQKWRKRSFLSLPLHHLPDPKSSNGLLFAIIDPTIINNAVEQLINYNVLNSKHEICALY